MRAYAMVLLAASVLPVAACASQSTPTPSVSSSIPAELGPAVTDRLDDLTQFPDLDPVTEMAGAIYMGMDEAPGDNDRQRLEAAAADPGLQERAAAAGITVTFEQGEPEAVVMVKQKGEGECRVIAQDDGRALSCDTR